MSEAGARQQEDNLAHKLATGSSPNGVANAWLAQHRGRQVVACHYGKELARGVLVGFDAYSIVIGTSGDGPVLLFKGPGILLRQP